VDGLFARLVRFGRTRPALVCYLRENGPIAYARDVFGREPRERASVLLEGDLAWHWRTVGRESSRDWTRLTAWSLAALLADVGAPDGAAAPPLVLIALEAADGPSEVGNAAVARWMREFDGGADRPLHAVLVRWPPDHELLFVAQHPRESVLQVLQAWGIDRDTAERRAYARLNDRSLAALARSLSSGGDTGVRS